MEQTEQIERIEKIEEIKEINKPDDLDEKWTAAQRSAITQRNKTLLVSAAAGSGKTAALTERIVRSLTDTKDPCDIDRMLVVTFTRAAASELRQRITGAISNSLATVPHLVSQLLKVSGAKICTIDSFYLDVVRANFDKVGLSPSFRTADKAELDVLARSLMEDTVDSFYEKRGDDFAKLAECFVNIRSTDSLSDVFLNLYSSTESLPEGLNFLQSSAELCEKEAVGDFFDSSFGKLIKAEISDAFSYYADLYTEMCDWLENDEILYEKYLPAFNHDKEYIDKVLTLLSTGAAYAECREYITSYKAEDLGRANGYKHETAEEYKELRNKFKDKQKRFVECFFGPSAESVSALLKESAATIRILHELLCDFETLFKAEKRQKNICSFTDIRRHAMTLLVNSDGTPTETALALRERYDAVYIDEYQDVDRIQDLIFRAISKPTARFMVGDIKQSIYSFRGAEPKVFSDYRRTFPPLGSDASTDSDEASIFMSNNFRCDSTVVRFTNAVCSRLFSFCEDMGYTPDDDLIFTKKVKDRKVGEFPTEVHVLVPTKNEEKDDTFEKSSGKGALDVIEETNKELEARYVARQIAKLLKDGKKADGSKILPHDIAVLFRMRDMGTVIKTALAKEGIACSDSSDSNYFENPDVLLVLCLLNVIDNPQRDVYLAGVLRSPFFDFSLDELIEIRKDADRSRSLYDALCDKSKENGALAEKCRAFDLTLTTFRDAAVSLSVDKLLRYLYSTDLFTASGLVSADADNNLIRLYEYARAFEGSSFKGLYSFIVYINRIIEQEKRLDTASGDICEGKVTLSTIHHSKGLEFPVCFVCSAGSYFNFKETRESLVSEPPYGIAMQITDGSGYARIDTPMRQALLGINRRKQIEEEMRILYVALTRAKERLIVTACSRSVESRMLSRTDLWRRYSCGYSVRSAHSYLDWILTAIDAEHPSDFCEVKIIDKTHIDTGEEADTDEENTVSEEEAKKAEQMAQKILSQRFSFVYPYAKAKDLPAKISVSKLPYNDEDSLKAFEDDEEKEAKLRIMRHGYTPPASLSGELKKEKPSPAQRGTATHLFLQFCDYERTKKYGVRDELSRLIERRFIPKDSLELAFTDELERFFESELYTEITNARRIYREQRFNVLLPPEVYSKDEEFLLQTKGEFLALQGVIDLVIEDKGGNIILCDYKTDRLGVDELTSDECLIKKMTESHGRQLSYYAEAVRRLFSKECHKVLVYSTHAAKAVEIDVKSI